MGKDQDLIDAARSGNCLTVEKLLSHKTRGPLASLRRGPGTNYQDSSGFSALHHAALNGHKEVVSALLLHEASPNLTDPQGSSPLHLAAWAGHADIVRLLLTQGPRVTIVNLTNKDQETALHSAAQYGHTAVVSLLLEHGADPNVRNIRGEAPLDLAALYGRLDTVELLLRSHPELVTSYRHSNAQHIFKITPLHAASRNGHRAVVEALLRASFPTSLKTAQGSALHEAALCGKVDVVRRLLEAGLDVTATDLQGKTALDLVANLGTAVAQEIVELIKNYACISSDARSKPESPLLPPFPTPTSPHSPYENVFLSRSTRSIPNSIEGTGSKTNFASIVSTLPRKDRNQRAKSKIKSRELSQLYDIPPSARDCSWMSQSMHEPGHYQTISFSRPIQIPINFHESDGTDPSCDRKHLLMRHADHPMSRSYDGRTLLNTSTISCPAYPYDDNDGVLETYGTLNRNHRARRSVDQYLPMTLNHPKKISPIPPQKPPRSQKSSTASSSHSNAGYEMVYLARTGSKNQSVEYETPRRFTVSSQSHSVSDSEPSSDVQYVDMVRDTPPRSTPDRVRESRYDNVELDFPEGYYDIPRQLVLNANHEMSTGCNSSSSSRNPIHDAEQQSRSAKPTPQPRSQTPHRVHTYENVMFSVPRTDDSTTSLESRGVTYQSSSISLHVPFERPDSQKREWTHTGEASSSNNSPVRELNGSTTGGTQTPPSPTHFQQPPTPDHPPPSAHLAERNIHDRIRPLSQDWKRKSRDMETETEEEVFLMCSMETPSGSGSASLSDKSVSTDNIEEVVGDVPFAGLMRGSIVGTPVTTSIYTRSLERPRTLKRDNDSHQITDTSGSRMTSRSQSQDAATEARSKDNPDLNLVQTRERQRGDRNANLSVLSPFDEQEEWAKISEILGTFGSGLGRESLLMDEVQKEIQARLGSMANTEAVVASNEHVVLSSVGEWLASLGLQQYENTLIVNGFDDLEFLGGGVVEDHVLSDLKMTNAEHRKSMVEASKKLPCSFPKSEVDTSNLPSMVPDWLQSLKLSEYEEVFRKNCYNDMERVQKVWEVELTTVLEIRKSGHLRRILASLGALSRAGPSSPVTELDNRSSQQQQRHHTDPSAAQKSHLQARVDMGALESEIRHLNSSIEKLDVTIGQNLPVLESTKGGTLGRGTLGRRKSRPAPPPPDLKPQFINVKPSSTRFTPCSTSSVSKSEGEENLVIRDPSQLVMGIAKAMTTQWRHKPEVLVNNHVCYQAQYLGSTLVRELKGTESTKRSIQKLKKKYQCESSTCKSVLLAISCSGVRFLETTSKVLICEHEIRNIHCACQDADDLTHFAYITKDHDTNDHFCHVFRVPSMELATEIILTLGEAFEVAYQMALKDETRLTKGHVRSHSANQLATTSASTSSSPIVPTTAMQPCPATHARSHSANEALLTQTTDLKDSIVRRPSSESGEVSGDPFPDNKTAPHRCSSTSVSSQGSASGRAPLAVTEEL